MSVRLLALVLSLLLLAACADASPTPAPTATPEPGISGSGMIDSASSLYEHMSGEDGTLAFPTPVVLQSYQDETLGITWDVPQDWAVAISPGVAGQIHAPSARPDQQAILTFAALSEASTTLDAAVAEVRQGAFGPFIAEVQPFPLGEFEGVRMTLNSNDVEGGPTLVWLMVAPTGRGVLFVPQSDLTRAQSVLDTLRPLQP